MTTETPDYPDRIWFFPTKFWAATRGLPKEQVEALEQQLWQMAETRDVEGLRKFDFIYVGNPYRRSRAS